MTRLKEKINRLIKGNLSWSEYVELLKSDPLSGYLFRLWQNTPDYTKEDEVDGDKMLADIRSRAFHQNHSGSLRQSLIRYISIPVFSIIFLAVIFVSYNQHLKPIYIIACASAEEPLTLVLPDSSTVWLNHGAELRYRKDFMKDRQVFLVGEGYFSVKSSQDATFKVSFGDAYVVVKGTEFNIRTEDDISEITLISGRIDFGVPGKDIYKEMYPSDQLIFNTSTYELQEYNNIPQLFDWRSSVYKFSDKPLDELIGLINSLFQTNVKLQKKVNNNNYFTGTIRQNESLPDILEKICITMDLRILENDNDLILY